MKTGEIIKQLITAKNYTKVRDTVTDDFIEFVRENMPSQYEYFREREEKYKNFKFPNK